MRDWQVNKIFYLGLLTQGLRITWPAHMNVWMTCVIVDPPEDRSWGFSFYYDFCCFSEGLSSGLLSGGWRGLKWAALGRQMGWGTEWLAEEDSEQEKKEKKEGWEIWGTFWGEQARGLNFLERPAVTEREKNSLRGSKLGSFGLRSPGMYTVFLSFLVIHCFSLDCYYTSKHHVVWGGY